MCQDTTDHDWALLLQMAQEWERTIAQRDGTSGQAFADWIRSSPAHLKAYLAHLTIETELQRMDACRSIDLDQLLKTDFQLENKSSR